MIIVPSDSETRRRNFSQLLNGNKSLFFQRMDRRNINRRFDEDIRSLEQSLNEIDEGRNNERNMNVEQRNVSIDERMGKPF